jgi:UDP-N-acetylmuramate--alanine ligase
MDDFQAVSSCLLNMLRPGDVLLTLGAGDVWKVGDTVLKSIKKTI